MPILQEINDPYYASTASTLGGMADGMIGNPAKSQAEAIALANQVQLRRAQQQKLEQEMADAQRKAQWDTADRKQSQDAQDAAGRYYGYATPAPVNGTPEDMERYYREQNFRDQTARLMTRSGKGAEDIAKGFNEYQTGFNAAHLPPNSTQYPPGVAGNPVAMKKFDEERGKGAADQVVADDASRIAAKKYLPEMLRARQHYSDASGYIGQFQGNEWTQGPQNLLGKLPFTDGVSRGVEKRAALQKEMSSFQGPQIAANNKGLGPMTNYEQQLARLPFAKVDDVNAKVGLDAFDGQLSHTLKTMGYNVPPAHITMLLDGIKNKDPGVLQEFSQAHGPQALEAIVGVLR